MVQSNKKFLKHLIISLLIIQLIKEIITSSRNAKDLKCIKKNKFDNIKNSTKTISSPEVCTSISSDCCYIKIHIDYINFNLTGEYCASVSGSIDNFRNHLSNLYGDALKFYTSTLYKSKEKFGTYARHLTTRFDKAYKWYTPSNDNEYSTYMQDHCGKFWSNGTCMLEKNESYFENFVKKFYEGFTGDFCSKKTDGDKCIMYDGARSNNAMIRPLLNELVGYLHVDQMNFTYVNTDDVVAVTDVNDEVIVDEDDDDIDATDKWTNAYKLDHKPVASITVTCSTSHKSENFIKFNFIYGLFLFAVLGLL